MSKIIAMIGPSGSGKSVLAKQILDTLTAQDVDAIIVNRDKVRELLFGYTEATVFNYYNRSDLGICEYKVTEVVDTITSQALMEGKIVIMDNTHVKAKYLHDLKKHGVPIEYKILETSLEVCIDRDSNRVRTVGEKVIKSQYQAFEHLKDNFKCQNTVKIEIIDQDPTLPHAFIFDIDGTLAQMKDRSPYDMSRVGEDTLRESVFDAYRCAKESGRKIIICTGRSGTKEGITNTIDWLDKAGIAFDEFYIRPADNYEADWKIKENMWRDIVKSYYIVAMYDDRNQVVKHARKLGFNVFQVAEGNF